MMMHQQVAAGVTIRWAPLALAVLLTLTGLVVPVAAQTPEAGERTMTVSVYFLRDEQIGAAHREIVIPEDKAVAAASMRELLAGPTDEEADAGLSTTIPEETELIDVSLESETKVATVDLSQEFDADGDRLSMRARLAQVVYTLTQFPTIETVTFQLAGEPVEDFGGDGIALDAPVGRADFEDVTPLIFVESPTTGDTIASQVRVWGTANTFEATFIIDIHDANDEVVAHEVVTATSGSGVRGTFDVEIDLGSHRAGEGTIVTYEISPRDGRKENVVEIPVEIEA